MALGSQDDSFESDDVQLAIQFCHNFLKAVIINCNILVLWRNKGILVEPKWQSLT